MVIDPPPPGMLVSSGPAEPDVPPVFEAPPEELHAATKTHAPSAGARRQRKGRMNFMGRTAGRLNITGHEFQSITKLIRPEGRSPSGLAQSLFQSLTVLFGRDRAPRLAA